MTSPVAPQPLTRTWFGSEIAAAAGQFHLPPRLVEALVLKESSGQTDAFRFEPGFWRRYMAKVDPWRGQNPRRVSSSYGLLQIMFITAAERGYPGEPEGLFAPAVGLEWGCRQLRYLLDWAATFPVSPARRLRSALAAYNGGRGGNAPCTIGGEQPRLRNDVYAASVLALYGRDTCDGEL